MTQLRVNATKACFIETCHVPNLCYPLFFFNDTATTEIYTLSLHDALPIWLPPAARPRPPYVLATQNGRRAGRRSEEHTSELQSRSDLVCRLLLEKKKTTSG